MSTEPGYRMDRSIPPGDFHLSSVGALRGDLPGAPSAAPARVSGERSAARSSGELRVTRTSGGGRVVADDERAIPVLRNADGVTANRISGAFAAARLVPRSRSAVANRVLNFTLALIATIVLAPVFVIVAALIRLTSPGPILYTQTRVGIDRRSRRALALYDRRARDTGGSPFTIYKFRSMQVDAERMSGAVWATPNDPRVTPVGRMLRKTRLDELPQLFNVLKGDMNIVGPRPERPTIVAQLRKDISEYGLRHRAKPGITGLAQISHAYDQSLDDVRQKVRYDLEYLRRQSVAEDVRIMLKTVPVMLFKRGGW
jgi:lipopolysaccharide/colanic/teichoic acid biosynthesis glycosyltransferase